jgi:hypothetical protein
VRITAPAAGLLTAMALHSLWNTSASVGNGSTFVGVYFLIMVPIFFGLVSVALVAMSREGRVVSQHLAPEVGAGVLTPGDVELLASLRDRRRARKAARRDGRAARQAMKAFQLAATELAFQRHRAERGLPSGSGGPEAAQRKFAEAVAALAEHLGPHVQQLRAEAEQRMAWRAAYAAAAQAQAAAAAAPLPPPGWHADPWGQARLRWWDGRAWTGYVA